MITVRGYKPTDYEAVKNLYLSPDSFGGQFDEDRDSSDRLNEQIARDSKSILVAEEDAILVGTVSILQDKRFAWLIRFAVINEEASQSLFDEASKILKERGHNQVLVYAPSVNPKFAQRYQNLDFQEGQQTYSSYWRPLG